MCENKLIGLFLICVATAVICITAAVQASDYFTTKQAMEHGYDQQLNQSGIGYHWVKRPEPAK